MKHFVLSIALSALAIVAVSATTQAGYYHRHITTGILATPTGTTIPLATLSPAPGRGNDEESTR